MSAALKVQPIEVRIVETPGSAYSPADSYGDWVRTNRQALARRWLEGFVEGTDAYAQAESDYDGHMFRNVTTEFTYYAESQYDLYLAEFEGEDEVQEVSSFWGPR